jgi:hypothetical protein
MSSSETNVAFGMRVSIPSCYALDNVRKSIRVTIIEKPNALQSRRDDITMDGLYSELNPEGVAL